MPLDKIVEKVERTIFDPSEKFIEKETNKGYKGIYRIHWFLEGLMAKMEIRFRRFEDWLDRVLAKIEGP